MRNISKHIYKRANQFTLLSVLMLIITLSLVVQATLTELSSQRLSPQSILLTVDSTLPADIQAQEQASINLGFDRDTNTEYTAYGNSKVTVQLAQETEITQIKVYNAAPYAISVQAWVSGSWQAVNGLQALDLSSLTDQWHSYAVASGVSTDRLQISLSASTGGSAAGLKELEIWGKAERVTINTGANLLAAVDSDEPPMQARVYAASQEEGIIGNVVGLADRAEDNTFNINIDQDRGSIKRAWLTYESHGAGHWVSVIRRINQQAAIGGGYRFASTAWAGQVEQINPAWLLAGENNIEFSVPAGNSYRIRKLKLLVELDDGSNLVDEITAAPESINSTAQFAHDGDSLSGWQPYGSSLSDTKNRHLQILFDKATQLDAIALQLDNSLAGKIELETLSNGEWGNAGVGAILGKNLIKGWNRLEIQSDKPVDGVKLLFFNGTGSTGEILEIAPIGSGVGHQQSPPRIEVSYPDAGQYYGESAYIRGFIQPVDNGSGPVKTFIAGREISRDDGAIEALVNKKEFTVEGNQYSVTVDARYPDGEQISRKIYLTDAYSAAAASAVMSTYAYTGSEPVKADSEVAGVSGVPGALIDNYRIEHDESVLQLSKEALDEGERPSAISIASLKHEDLPPLNLGMTNVTKGPRNGYRFSPHGKKFRKNIDVYISYDKTKIPPGLSEDDIKTWYFDEEVGRWVQLEKVSIDTKAKVLKSHTDHFTDMINATLTVPENPEAASFNPTQIKDIKAANPAAGINFIEPPQANNQGSANLSYPIEIPAGRNGMQPQLAVSYNSGGGNGWLGLGWGLSFPSITIETRWGVPRYDSTDETETYLLNGQQLTPLAHRGELQPREDNKEDFQLRVEGSFQKIKRHGTTPQNYWWEVTDKNGTRSFYGGDEDSQIETAIIGSDKGVFRWMLAKTIDANDNTVVYEYEEVCDTGLGEGTCVTTMDAVIDTVTTVIEDIIATVTATVTGEYADTDVETATSIDTDINGKQLYIQSINYTGHLSMDAPYSVEFIRDSANPDYSLDYSLESYDPTTDRRRDVQIDARGGFKQVTAERLKDIVVKYNDEVVRSYEMVYDNGVFNKSLLLTIIQKGAEDAEFNRHEFDYFNEVPVADDNVGYDVFATDDDNNGVTVTTGDDELFEETFTGKTFHQTLIGGTFGRNNGYSSTFGIGFPFLGTIVAGTDSSSGNSSSSEGKVSLMDIDGDGQPDKVFLKGSALQYRKNLTEVGSEELVFSDDVFDVNGTLGSMSRSSSDSSTNGFNGYVFGGTVFSQSITTTSTDKAYFSDINGDGLVDHVNNGRVKFGYRDMTDPSNPGIKFSEDSGYTENPINGGPMSAADIFASMQAVEDEFDAKNPLLDAYRRWEAPYNGTIRIEGSVQLHDYSTDPDPDVVLARARYKTADGVWLTIQKDGAEYWRSRIEADDHEVYEYTDLENEATNASELNSIQVSRGDHIYFRVLSVNDGMYDRVNWAPKIVYIDGEGLAKNFLDVNNINVYRNDTSEDTIFAGIPVTIPAPYDGDIHFTGRFTKPETTDDITISINIYEYDEANEEFSATPKTGDYGSYSLPLRWNDEGEFDLTTDLKVETGDKITFDFRVDSSIDLQAIQWVEQPKMYYTYAEQPSIELLEPLESDSGTSLPPEEQTPSTDISDLEDLEVDLTEGMVSAGVQPGVIVPVQIEGEDKDGDGVDDYIINLPVRYNTDIYSVDDLEGEPQEPWKAEFDGVLLVTPWLAVNTKDDLCVEENDRLWWWHQRCNSVDPTPDGDVYFTIKRRGERVHKQLMKVRDEQVVAIDNAYEALVIIPVKAGEELFFDFTTRDDVLIPRIRHAQVKFEYGSRTPWTVPLTDEVTVSTRTHTNDSRDDDDAEQPSTPATAVVLIRRGAEEVLGLHKVAIEPGQALRIDKDFTLNVSEGEKLYFDFFTAETSLNVYSSSAWTRYQGASPWLVPRTGRVAFDPILNYKPDSIPDGNLKLKVFRNNNFAGERNYIVTNGAIDLVFAPYPLVINVNKDDQIHYELWTDTHLLSSTLSDKGQVSIDYVDTASWTVPSDWSIPDSQVSQFDIELKPSLVFDFESALPDGEVVFFVKDGEATLAEQTYTVKKGRLTTPVLPINLQVNRNQKLEFIFTHVGGSLLPYLVSHDVTVTFLDQDYPVPSVFNTLDIIKPITSLHILMPHREQRLPLQDSVLHFPEWSILYGNPYRGWAQAAYLAKDDRADVAMDENLLFLSDKREDYNDSYDTDVYPAMPTFDQQRWDGIDPVWTVGADYISSTRRGLKYIKTLKAEDFIYEEGSVNTAGIIRVPRFSYSQGYSDGGGFILTRSRTSTTTNGRIDLMDLNGDRYPDIISEAGVQFTLPDGGMNTFDEGLGLNALRLTRTSDSSLSYGGGTEPPVGGAAKVRAALANNPDAQKIPPPTDAADTSSSPLSGGGSFGDGNNDGIVDYIDMNGDGLLDRVTVAENTNIVSVELNLGYSFTTAEVWGTGYSSKGTSKTFAFNVGWSTPGKSFSGGIGMNVSSNDVAYRLMDMNGDGLTDYVYTSDNGLMVAINYGGSLGEAIPWGQSLKTLDDLSGLGPLQGVIGDDERRYSLSDGLSSSVSVSGSATATLPIIPIIPLMDITWAGGINYGETVSQPTIGFNDINGDGFIDSIRSGNDSELEVSLSQIGRTNLLKGVSRPLGSRFEVDYERTGNTYEVPQSIWTLNQVSVYDGVANDTSTTAEDLSGDYQVFKYHYADGKQDRFEREFLGFATVNQQLLDTRGQNATTTGDVLSDSVQATLSALSTFSETLQTFHNESTYSKGLLKSSLSRGLDDDTEQLLTYTENLSNYSLRVIGTSTVIDLNADTAQQDLADLSPAATVFPAMLSTDVHHYEGQTVPGISTRQEFDYDAYGNVTLFKDLADVTDANDDVEAVISYTDCTDSHIRKAETITVNGKGYLSGRGDDGAITKGILRQRTGDIDCITGNMNSITQMIDSSHSAITSLVYQANGNLQTVTRPEDDNGDSYILNYLYDDDVDTYVKEVTNTHFDYKSTTLTDPKFGKPLCSSDLNDNQMRYDYDQFGRTTRIVGPQELGEAYKGSCPATTADLASIAENIYTIKFDYHPYVDINDTQHDSWAYTQHYDRDASGVSKANSIDTYLFIDGLSRVLQTKKDASVSSAAGSDPVEKMIVSGRVILDAMGRSVEQYYPITEVKGVNASFNSEFDSIDPTTTTYDALGRALETTLPDTTSTSQSYGFADNRDGDKQFHTQITDAKGYIKHSYTDARELITSIKESVENRNIDGIIEDDTTTDSTAADATAADNTGSTTSTDITLWTTYNYDAMKQITDVIDANSNTTLVDYDLLGRRTLIDNPDTGATQYQYDKAGNLTHKITANAAAKGDSINYLYDRSRLSDIQYPQSEHNIHYDYGSSDDKAKNQQGRIKQVQHSAGIETREYGTLGETTLEQFTVTAVRPAPVPTYTTQYEFDTFGRLMNLQYPNGEVLRHHYDSGGNVSKISGKLQGQDYDYLQKLHYDQFEQRLYMQLGNGTETSYDYKPENRRLQNLQTEGDVAGQFQNINYTYDNVGNITKLSNNVNIARASDVGGPTEQNFDYDQLHRLITANGQFSPSQTRHHYYTLDMAYDGIHNISQKRQKHSFGRDESSARIQRSTTYDWQYGYDAQSSNTAAGPHAPTRIDTRDFHYDANGNQTGWNSTVSGQKRSIIWDDENRIREINDPGNTAWYSYDDEGQRKIKRGRYGETVYVNQFLTVRDGALATQHVYAGNTRVVSKLKAGKPIGKSPTDTKQNNGTNPTTASASNQSNASSNNGKNTTATTGESNHPGQGLLHRSDRANEVAQNTVKNPNLINAGEDDTGEEDTGTDTGTDDTGEDTDTGDTTGTLADIAYDFTGGAEFLYYYHPDHLGSTGFVTDNKGELFEHIEYFPFGETWVQESTSTWKVPYMYTSKELDEDTQLYYYGARYYDPRTSVWQSADPILGSYLPSGNKEQDQNLPGMGGVFNSANLGLYTYTHQNPVKLIDPDGNASISFAENISKRERAIVISNVNSVEARINSQSTGQSKTRLSNSFDKWNVNYVGAGKETGLAGKTDGRKGSSELFVSDKDTIAHEFYHIVPENINRSSSNEGMFGDAKKDPSEYGDFGAASFASDLLSGKNVDNYSTGEKTNPPINWGKSKSRPSIFSKESMQKAWEGIKWNLGIRPETD